MRREKLKHYALIPAKNRSFRCPNKNWHDFNDGKNLVDFTLKTIPEIIFDKIVVSTDRSDYRCPQGVEKHLRSKTLASKRSLVTDLMQLIISEYNMSGNGYLWLLNPTSPFRRASDYRSIAKIIDKERPGAVISVADIHPFLWKDNRPLFETTGRRTNTEDFKIRYGVENGMFYAVNVKRFLKSGSWYGPTVELYRQSSIWANVDIDTKSDFMQARKLAAVWDKDLEGYALCYDLRISKASI